MSFEAAPFVEERQKVSQARLTKYPELFINTYWAGHKLFPGEKEDIIENRNKFVEEFFLQDAKVVGRITDQHLRRKVLMKYFHDKEDVFRETRVWDHMEYYKLSSSDYVIITSPYAAREKTDIQMEVLGWKKYLPLYNNMATTYVLKIGLEEILKMKQHPDTIH